MEGPFIQLLIVASAAIADQVRKAVEPWQDFGVTQVGDLAEARCEILANKPDVVIAAPLLPDGRALSLLNVIRNNRPPLLILLADRDDSRAAVQAIKAGACDYLVNTPETLANLPRMLERCLRDRAQRSTQRREFEHAARFGHILAQAITEIYTFDAETLHFVRVNRGGRENLGYSKRELRQMTPLDLQPGMNEEAFAALLEPLRSGTREVVCYETVHQRKNGSFYPVEVHLQSSGLEPLVFVAVCLDISDRRQMEAQLEASEARFRSIFNIAAAGMAVLTPDGEILDVNPALCRFLGYRAEELIGKNIIEFTAPHDREATQDYYRQLAAQEDHVVSTEKRYLCKDGQVRWGYVSVACVAGAGMGPVYCVGLVQDISQRKEAEEQLQQANRDLDAFAQVIAHDLRSPLTPIIGMAEFLQAHARGILDPQALSFLQGIEDSGRRMLALLEDLLTLAQVGYLPPPEMPVDPRQLLDQLLADLQLQLHSSGTVVQMGELPALYLPGSLVYQLFVNLVGNAVRYAGGPDSPIEIGSRCENSRVQIFVRDHGPGVAPDEQEQIFEVFYRGGNGRQHPGTGIGLATVRKIARLYAGDAWWEETPGGGSTFWVEFPATVVAGDDGDMLDEEISTAG